MYSTFSRPPSNNSQRQRSKHNTGRPHGNPYPNRMNRGPTNHSSHTPPMNRPSPGQSFQNFQNMVDQLNQFSQLMAETQRTNPMEMFSQFFNGNQR